MEFLQKLQAARAALPNWAPAGAAVVELTETPFGPLRVAVVPVDAGERAARAARGMQALAPGLRAMAKLKSGGVAAAGSGDLDAAMTLINGALDGVTRSLAARSRDHYALAVWLLTEGVIGLGSPEGDGWTWAPCRPVMAQADEVIPPVDGPPGVEIRPWVVLFWQLGPGAVSSLMARIDALTGVE